MSIISEAPALSFQVSEHINESNSTNHFQALEAAAGILQREQTLTFSTL